MAPGPHKFPIIRALANASEPRLAEVIARAEPTWRSIDKRFRDGKITLAQAIEALEPLGVFDLPSAGSVEGVEIEPTVRAMQAAYDFPDRFMVGLDLFAPAHYRAAYVNPMVAYYRGLLGQLHAQVADMIGHANAERIGPFGVSVAEHRPAPAGHPDMRRIVPVPHHSGNHADARECRVPPPEKLGRVRGHLL